MNEQPLPAPHPAFAAHFTNPIYDPGLIGNDDLLPFGTDEGFDTVWEWAPRSSELQSDPRLDLVLGTSAAEVATEAEEDDESAAWIIAAGFTLLRYTGHIGQDDKRVLLATLQRQTESRPDVGIETMISDLEGFRPAALREAVATRPQRLRPPRWLSIVGYDEDDRLVSWCRRLTAAINDDPGWREWWDGADHARLVLHPVLLIPTTPKVLTGATAVEVVGGSAALAELTASWVSPDNGSMLELSGVEDALLTLIMDMLRRTSKQLKMSESPGALPNRPAR